MDVCMFTTLFAKSFNISARNRTQDLNNMSSALPLSYWNIDQKRWCSWHVSSTGCKHSSVINMNRHQEIRASSASREKQFVMLPQLRLNNFELLLELCIYEWRGTMGTWGLNVVKNKLDAWKDNQLIHQSIKQSITFNQIVNQLTNQPPNHPIHKHRSSTVVECILILEGSFIFCDRQLWEEKEVR